jgi:L-alanine-DL-glutamate epimerase-like enolase superfamily enzyme
LHVWGDPKKDIAAFRAVKEAVGEDMVLIFDAAMAYNHEEALWVGRQLEEMDC